MAGFLTISACHTYHCCVISYVWVNKAGGEYACVGGFPVAGMCKDGMWSRKYTISIQSTLSQLTHIFDAQLKGDFCIFFWDTDNLWSAMCAQPWKHLFCNTIIFMTFFKMLRHIKIFSKYLAPRKFSPAISNNPQKPGIRGVLISP